jgi:hypothetical protein
MMLGEAAVVYYEMLCRNLPKGAEDVYRIHVKIFSFWTEASTCFGKGWDEISAKTLTMLAEFSQFV